jgi:hypothetical protein
LEGRLALESLAGTRQERRRFYLDLAAEAETIAAKLGDPKVRAAWIDLTISWMMIASEISPVEEGSGKRLFSGVPYWTAVAVDDPRPSDEA